MALGRIEVELVIDNNGFTQTIRQAGQTISTLNSNLNSLNTTITRTADSGIGSLTKGFRGLVLDINLVSHAIQQAQQFFGSWFGAMIGASAAFEKSVVMMEGLSTATDAAGRALEATTTSQYLLQMSMANPFGIKALQDAYIKLKSVGLDPTDGAIAKMTGTMEAMDVETQKNTTNMQALLDAVATFGGTSDELQRATLAIQQMAGKGVISMEELRRQLGEAVPNAVQVMARSLGMTYAELVKKVSLGQVLAKPAITLMLQQMELEMGGASKRMMDTWDGLISHLKSSLTVFAIEAGKSGYFEALKEQIRDLIMWLESPAGIEAAANFGKMISGIASAVISLTRFLIEHAGILKAVALAYVGLKVVSIVSGMVTAFSMAMMRASAPMALFSAGTAAARANLAALSNSMVTAGASATGLGVSMRALGVAIGAAAGPIGIVITALAAAAMAWDNYADSATAAQEALQETEGKGGTKKELEDAAEMTTQAAVEMDKYIQAIEKYKKNISDLKSGKFNNFMSPEEIKRDVAIAETTIADLTKKFEAEQAKMTQGLRYQSNARVAIWQREGRNLFNWAQTELGGALKEIQDKYRKMFEANDKDTNISQEERFKKRNDIMREEFSEQIKMWEDWIADKEKLAAKANGGDIDVKGFGRLSAEGLKNAIQGARKEIQRMHEEMKRGDTITSTADLLVSGGKAAKGFKTELLSLAEKAAEMEAKMKGMTDAQADAIGKIARKAKEDSLGENAKVTAEMLMRQAEATGEVERRYDAYVKKQKEVADLNEYADDTTRRLTAELSEMQKRMADPAAYDKMSENMRTILKEIEHAKTLGKDGAAALEKLEKAMKMQAAADLAKDIEKLIEKTHEWNAATMTARDARQADYAKDMEEIRAIERQLVESGEATEEAMERMAAARAARTAKYKNDSMSELSKLAREWDDLTEQMNQATANWARSGMDAIMEFVKTGKMNFKDLTQSILADLARIMIQKALAGVVGSIGEAFGNAFLSSGTGNGAESIQILPADSGPAITPDAITSDFAMGGIMTSFGAMSLRKYAAGGVATSPQLALYGEGSKPEAYVPLPDGRTIPVTMKGSSDEQKAPNVSVNVINQSGQDVDASGGKGMKFDGKEYILDVVLTASQTPGRFRDAMKSRS